MDDRDRRAPIALAAHAPVAQAIDGRTLAPAFAFGAGDHGALGLFNGQPIEKAGIHQRAGAGIGLVALEHRARLVALGDDAADLEAVFAREIKIALVDRKSTRLNSSH